jgi:hypothetical protein
MDMSVRRFLLPSLMMAAALATNATPAFAQAATIDNSAIGQSGFREHKATYGVVYRLPRDVTDTLDAKVMPELRLRLLKIGLAAETMAFNLPHVTVVHIHSADPATPARMLKALPKPPAPLAITLKDFYNTEAARGAGAPWWFDLGIVKSGKGFDDMMAFNVAATAALTPLRDGPLPRVTGPVYAAMADAGKELVRTVGVSGVNVMKDGKATASHNPHNTLVYSMTPYDAPLQAAMKEVADHFNTVLPAGMATTFSDVSIVEIGFMGNVVREFYRVSLQDGRAWDVTSGQMVKAGE